MKILEIYVGRFGPFEDRRVGLFSPGLTLVRGNNEEGKTTLLEMVRALLFGFRERSARNPYIPPKGGGRMGALEIEGIDGSRWRVERAEGPRGGRVRVLSAQGMECSTDVLMDMLHRTDRHLFESVFAFGLKELQEIESLHSKEVQGRIMGAAAGTGVVSPVDVWRKLMEQARFLFKPSGKTQPVGRAARVLDDLEVEIQQIRNLPARYAELSRHRKEALLKREEARCQLASVQEDCARCQKLVNLEQTWKELLKVDAQIREFEPAAHFPPDGVRRLEETLKRIRTSQGLVEGLETRIREADKERNRPIPDEEIIRFWPEIDALAQRAAALGSLPDELGKAQGKEAAEHQNMKAALNDAGDGWDQERALEFDASASTEQAVIKWESQLREAQDELRRCRERLESAATEYLQKERALEDAEKALSDEMPSRDPVEQPAARDRLEEWMRFFERAQAAGDRAKSLEAALDEALQDKDELAAQAARFARETEAPFPAWLPAAVAVILTAAALLSALSGSMLTAALLTGSGLAGAVWLRWFRRRLLKDSGARLTEARAQQERHQQRLERRIISLKNTLREAADKQDAARRHMASISKELMGREDLSEHDALSLLARARSAGESMGRRQALQLRAQQIRKEMERALEDRSRVMGELENLQKVLQQIQDEWVSWQKERDLSGEVSPGALRVLLQGIRDFQHAYRQWEESSKTVAHWKTIWDNFSRQAADLLVSCGREVPEGYDVLGAIQNLRKDCQAALEASRQRQQLEERIREDIVQMDGARKRLHEDEAEREKLLAGAGVKDDESFLALGPPARRREELIVRRRELLASLKVGADQPDEESLRGYLQAIDWEDNRVHLDEQESETAKLIKLVDSLGVTIGRLESDIISMEQSDRLSLLLQQREQAYAQLQESAWTWATTSTAAALLDLARRKYETQRQPTVIRWASEIFRQMTGGVFSDLRLPLDKSYPMVLRTSGELVPIEHLSRGTAEQLYLAIRMALIREYVKQAGPLPVIMDDILVNFDPERGRAAAQSIAEFSRTTPIQVIFFTCHPHVVHYFQTPPNSLDILDLGRLL